MASKIDLFSRRVMYDQAFNLETPEGVLRFLRCYHDLKARRNEGDLEAAILIIDFIRAWNKCKYSDWPLTRREKQVIYLLYGLGLSKSEVSQRLGISIPALRKHEKKAARKLAMLIGGRYGSESTRTEHQSASRSETETRSEPQKRTGEQPD